MLYVIDVPVLRFVYRANDPAGLDFHDITVGLGRKRLRDDLGRGELEKHWEATELTRRELNRFEGNR